MLSVSSTGIDSSRSSGHRDRQSVCTGDKEGHGPQNSGLLNLLKCRGGVDTDLTSCVGGRHNMPPPL